jgi:hypothetical protein
MRIQSVNPVNLLEPYRTQADSKQRLKPPVVEMIDGVEDHVVKEVAGFEGELPKEEGSILGLV